MPEPRNQQEIMERFMGTQTDDGQETTEKVRFPGIAHLFEGPADGAEVKTASVKVPGILVLGQKSREEIAEVLTGLLEYKAGVVGFEWLVGDDHIDVKFVDGLRQRVPKTEEDIKALNEFVCLVLKVRRNVTALCWDFGQPAIEISYTV